MLITCLNCKEEFVSKRKDKRYCTTSCKQMDYLRRKIKCVTFQSEHQQIGTITKESEQHPLKIKTSIDASQKNTIVENGTKKNQEERLKNKTHQYVQCHWLQEIYIQLQLRDTQEKLYVLERNFSNQQEQIRQINIHFRSLLECLLTVSELNKINREDLIELCNAYTRLIKSENYAQVPQEYPYRAELKNIRNKLKQFILENKEEEIVFRLGQALKQQVMLYRYELAQCYKKISFNELIHQQYQQQKISCITNPHPEQEEEPKKKSNWRENFRQMKKQQTGKSMKE